MQKVITSDAAKMMSAAISEKAFACIPQEYRDTLRAAIFKNMLVTQV